MKVICKIAAGGFSCLRVCGLRHVSFVDAWDASSGACNTSRMNLVIPLCILFTVIVSIIEGYLEIFNCCALSTITVCVHMRN